MTNGRLKIAFIGGGSLSWMPTLARDLMLTPRLAEAECVLLDIDRKASDLTKAFLEKLARELNVGTTFVSTDRAEDLSGAQYLTITLSTGGLTAVGSDLAIPEDYGIYHTVGDTSGPGGWARAIRNFPVFVEIAENINRYAPDAVILNYSNPMTPLTDILARLCRGPVVGLCHAVVENVALIKTLYGLGRDAAVSLLYGGINHFIWATRAWAGTVDVLADLTRRLESRSLTDLVRDAGLTSTHDVVTELFRLTGALPYLGDRHICEFFSCYITNRETMEKYKLTRTPVEARRERMQTRRDRITAMIAGEIDPGFKTRTAETFADLLDAHRHGGVFLDVGNLPNMGQISNLPAGLIVETAMRVDPNGFTPLTVGALPPIVQGLIEPYALVFPLIVDACFEKSKKKALQALRLDPVCAHLTTARVLELGERLLKAQDRFNPVWQ